MSHLTFLKEKCVTFVINPKNKPIIIIKLCRLVCMTVEKDFRLLILSLEHVVFVEGGDGVGSIHCEMWALIENPLIENTNSLSPIPLMNSPLSTPLSPIELNYLKSLQFKKQENT